MSNEAPPPAANTFPGAFKIGRYFGTEVFVHWSWFLVAYYIIKDRPNIYSSMAWNVAEYVAGFGLVTLHEFGHVLACRSVGGKADRVLLWPMGGLAYVAPPPRPGASLWTTIAGPLVNVVLAPILIGLAYATAVDADVRPPDIHLFFFALAFFNVIMLVFNLLPIFPLDGGRILQALLWYAVGHAKSLAIASYIGIAGGIAIGGFALAEQEWWFAAMAVFLVLGAYGGVVQSRRLAAFEALPRRDELSCPNCGEHPPIGPFWRCSQCNVGSDLFSTEDCPAGGFHVPVSGCPACGQPCEVEAWKPSEPR